MAAHALTAGCSSPTEPDETTSNEPTESSDSAIEKGKQPTEKLACAAVAGSGIGAACCWACPVRGYDCVP